jgi:hypothetical protein
MDLARTVTLTHSPVALALSLIKLRVGIFAVSEVGRFHLPAAGDDAAIAAAVDLAAITTAADMED